MGAWVLYWGGGPRGPIDRIGERETGVCGWVGDGGLWRGGCMDEW